MSTPRTVLPAHRGLQIPSLVADAPAVCVGYNLKLRGAIEDIPGARIIWLIEMTLRRIRLIEITLQVTTRLVPSKFKPVGHLRCLIYEEET